MSTVGVVDGYYRIAAHDGRTCAACLMAEGEFYRNKESLRDHPNGRCLAPGMLVHGRAIEALVSRRYRGDMLTIRLASGQFLRITPNHPVLTERGWIGAKLLKQGDNVICHSFSDGTAPGIDPDEQNMPTLIEEVSSALDMDRLASVPSAAKDFHGDGMESDVYVVWSNSLLRSGRKATGMKPFSEKFFGRRDAATLRLSALGNIAAVLRCLLAAARSLLGNLDTTVMLLNRRLFSQQAIGFYLATPGNTLDTQPCLYDRSRNTVGLCEGVFRFTRQIPPRYLFPRHSHGGPLSGPYFEGGDSPALSIGAKQATIFEGGGEPSLGSMELPSGVFDTLAPHVCFDSVLEINASRFDGHVYNLQTSGKWYNAGGSIQQHGGCVKFPVVHNCSTIPKVRGLPPLQWQKGPDWFRVQPEATQLQILGPGKYAAWRDGKFKLADLVTVRKDATWGDSVTPTPLRELVKA